MIKTKGVLNWKLLVITGFMSGVITLGFNIFFALPTQAKVSFNKEEKKFIQEINDYRESKGLKPLEISSELSKAAEAMANDMADNPDTINHEHKDSQGRLPAERAAIYGYTDGVGENLAAGYETSAKVFKAWKGSSEHKANMVDKDYEVMGVARIATGNNYKWYWVNMFGEKGHSNDIIAAKNYKSVVKINVTVTDPNGNPLKNAKISVLTKGRSKLAGGKTSTKGKKTFTLDFKDEYYVRATATGYQPYTKRVKPGSKTSITVKMWLEK